jgi:hypothetical protein
MKTERQTILEEIKLKLDERVEHLQTNTETPSQELLIRVFENNLMAVYINGLLLEEVTKERIKQQNILLNN